MTIFLFLLKLELFFRSVTETRTKKKIRDLFVFSLRDFRLLFLDRFSSADPLLSRVIDYVPGPPPCHFNLHFGLLLSVQIHVTL